MVLRKSVFDNVPGKPDSNEEERDQGEAQLLSEHEEFLPVRRSIVIGFVVMGEVVARSDDSINERVHLWDEAVEQSLV